MDKLIDHLFSLGIPGFFLALALLYELAISLKLKFGRSWLYKEIRESLQNPAARKLLMHDLRSRPSLANLKYVGLLLGSHNWLNRYLDSTHNFTKHTLPWWQHKIIHRPWHQYLIGQSFVWCFALATIYPLIFFLLRFALSGNTELTNTNTSQLPTLERWLIVITFAISITAPFIYYYHPLKKMLVTAYRRFLRNNQSNLLRFTNKKGTVWRFYHGMTDIVVRSMIVAVIITVPLSILYYSKILLNDSSLALSIIFATTFLMSCANGKKNKLSALSVAFALALLAVLIFGFSAEFFTNADLSPYSTFIRAFIFVVFFTIIAVTILHIRDSKNGFLHKKIFAISNKTNLRMSMTVFLVLVYVYLYLVPICTSDLSAICSPPTSPANGLSVFLLLVIALPPINAILDWLSLALSRYCFDKVLLHSRWTQWLYITLDLIGAIVTLVLLYTLIFWVLGRFELLFPHSVGDVAAMRELWWRSPWHPDVLWITVMGATTMIMTLLHILTSLYGLFFWLPQDLRQRRYYAHKLAAEAKRVPILPGEKYPASELHHQIAHFLTIGRDAP